MTTPEVREVIREKEAVIRKEAAKVTGRRPHRRFGIFTKKTVLARCWHELDQ